jgi:N utilization substance protein A
VQWNDDPSRFVANALSPAQAISVVVHENERRAIVTVPDAQLSLAIGKEGQNARLAAKLTGWRVYIKKQSDSPAAKAAAPVPPPPAREPEPDVDEGDAITMEELLEQVPVEARDEG